MIVQIGRPAPSSGAASAEGFFKREERFQNWLAPSSANAKMFFNFEVKHCEKRAKARILDTPFEAKQGKERAQIGSKMRSGIIAV